MKNMVPLCRALSEVYSANPVRYGSLDSDPPTVLYIKETLYQAPLLLREGGNNGAEFHSNDEGEGGRNESFTRRAKVFLRGFWDGARSRKQMCEWNGPLLFNTPPDTGDMGCKVPPGCLLLAGDSAVGDPGLYLGKVG